MKFEEVFPAFKEGKKIRRKVWFEKQFIYREGLSVYREDGGYYHVMSCDQLLRDDWEIIEEPEPDWDYIIKNKCLCWFWDSNFNWAMCGTLGQIEKGFEYEFTMFDEAENGIAFKHCRPVRRDEVTFYEGKEDEDS